MITIILIALVAFAGMFVLFLVIAATLNNTINCLTRIEYLLQKEYDFKKEALEIKHLLEQQAEEERKREEDRKAAEKGLPPPSAMKK